MKGDKCSYRFCGKDAIGIEHVTTSMFLNVCENHASNTLKNLKSGETYGKVNTGRYGVKY